MSTPTGDDMPDDVNGVTAPTFGVNYAVGPVVAGVMYYTLGFDWTMEDPYFGDSSSETKMNYLGLSVAYPIPVGPVVIGAGAMYGLPMGGTSKVEMLGMSLEMDLEGSDMDADLGVVLQVNYPVTDAIGVGVGMIYGLGEYTHMTLGGGLSYSL